jgi:hypothetical protein
MKFTIAQKKSVIVLSRHIDRWDFTTPDNNSKKKKDANILLLIIHDNNNQREGKAPNQFSMLIMFVSPLKFTPRKEMYMLPRSTIQLVNHSFCLLSLFHSMLPPNCITSHRVIEHFTSN